MFTTIDHFVQEFEAESALTEQVLLALTDESLTQAMTDTHRTLGRVAWHLVSSFNYLTHIGLTLAEPLAEQNPPASAARIASEYRRLAQCVVRAVRSQWTDDTLQQVVNVGDEAWSNGATLRFTLRHEIHHRGQITVLMRQAGLRIPPIFGPTRDEWIEQGVEPHA